MIKKAMNNKNLPETNKKEIHYKLILKIKGL